MGGTGPQLKSADSSQRQVDGAGPATGLSRSVTSTDQNQSYLLQIETNQTRLPENLNL